MEFLLLLIFKIQNSALTEVVLKSTQCPHCLEPNKRYSTFCTKCHMVLKYESYLEEKKKHDLEMMLLKTRNNARTRFSAKRNATRDEARA